MPAGRRLRYGAAASWRLPWTGLTYQARRDDEIADAWKAGLSYRDIAKEVGLTHSSVSDHLYAMGLGGPTGAAEQE